MSHPFYHAQSSARRFGGEWEDYIHIHEWFDQTKAHHADTRHRALLHNSFGIFLCQQVFGETLIRKSDGKEIPLRPIGEQHIIEDIGRIPSVSDYLNLMTAADWMNKAAPLSKILKEYEEMNEQQRPSGKVHSDGQADHQGIETS